MSDLPEPGEDATPPPPKKTSNLAWGCVIVFFALVAVDFLSVYMMGRNTNHTFSNIGPVPNAPPVKQPVPSHK